MDYPSRVAKLQEGLIGEELDGFFIEARPNTEYYSGFRGSSSYLLITRATGFFFTDFRYIEWAQKNIHHLEVRMHNRDFFEQLQNLILDLNLKIIGFEGTLSYNYYHQLIGMSSEITFIECSDLLKSFRQIKTPDEIELIRTALDYDAEIFKLILNDLHIGMRELDIRKEFRRQFDENSAEGESFPTIVASGPNASLPHAMPSFRTITSGDFVIFDFGVRWHSYCSDVTRTIVLGKADEKQKEVYGIVLQAQLKAIKAARPGMSGGELDAVAREYIAKAGYGEYFGHGLGHGVGLECHEAPTLNPRSEEILEPGMIVTIEPGIYIPDWGGVRIEDIVLITKKGCEVLTNIPRRLIELGV